MITAVRTTPSEAIGRRRPGRKSSSIVASQKLGMLRPISPPTRMAASSAVPLRIAEAIPMGSATARAKASASTVNSALTGSRARMSGRTGRLVRSETPKSPRTTRPIQSAYWSGSGLFRPNSRRSSSICAGVMSTWVPRNIWSAFPGIRWMSKKTTTDTPQRTGRRVRSRARINAATRPGGRSALDRGLFQVGERPGRDQAEPLDVRLQDGRLVRGVQEDRRRLLDELALEVVVDRLALGARHVHAAAVEQLVHLGVLEEEVVDRAGAVERPVQEPVGVGIAAPELDHRVEVALDPAVNVGPPLDVLDGGGEPRAAQLVLDHLGHRQPALVGRRRDDLERGPGGARVLEQLPGLRRVRMVLGKRAHRERPALRRR